MSAQSLPVIWQCLVKTFHDLCAFDIGLVKTFHDLCAFDIEGFKLSKQAPSVLGLVTHDLLVDLLVDLPGNLLDNLLVG